MVYWALATPYQIGLGTVWLLAFVADLLHGDLLGERALLISLIVFLVIKLQARIQLFPLGQQILVVFLLALLFQLIQFLIFYILGHSLPGCFYWLGSFTTAICWPLLLFILGPYQRRSFEKF